MMCYVFMVCWDEDSCILMLLKLSYYVGTSCTSYLIAILSSIEIYLVFPLSVDSCVHSFLVCSCC